MAENYMDRFATPEEFIRSEILANRGSNNVIDKTELLAFVELKAGDDERLDNLTKAQLFDRLSLNIVENAGAEIIEATSGEKDAATEEAVTENAASETESTE